MALYNATTGQMDFSLALDVLKRGNKVRRNSWENGYVSIQGSGFFMWMPHREKDVAWVPSWEELLAKDWVEVIGD